MRSVNSWCGLGEHECAWGEPRCDVHLLISDLSTAEATLDRVRALCLPGRASVWIADIRAAIDGTEE